MWAVVASPEMWKRRAGRMEGKIGLVLGSLELILNRRRDMRTEGGEGITNRNEMNWGG